MDDKNQLKKDSKRRLKDILAVLVKHNIVKGLTPEKLKMILEEMGPTFVKMGQLLSMRSDLLPVAYCEELVKLREDVLPLSYDEVKYAFLEEYGALLEETFLEFRQKPLGSASIAQVHYAVLKNGKPIVVKIQRPGIYQIMAADIALLKKVSRLAKIAIGSGDVIDFREILNEMWFAAQQEMDFLIESKNADEFYELNKHISFISCPRIEHQYTTSKILIMDYIDGIDIDDNERLLKEGYDLKELGSKLVDHYIKQIIDDGFFHADPHPGNIKIKAGKIVWIDFGMMGRLTKKDQMLLKNAVKAVASNDVNELKNTILSMGNHNGKIDQSLLYADIEEMLREYSTVEIININLGRAMQNILSIANKHHISMPKNITMLSRGILTIEGVLCRLNPDANIMEMMANRISNEFIDHFDINKELKDSGKAIYFAGKKTLDIPVQLSDFLKQTIKGQTRVNIELTGSEPILKSINKMINKIIICIIDAAMIMGSCLLCLTDMQPEIMGVPILGAMGFFASFVVGIWLLIRMFKKEL